MEAMMISSNRGVCGVSSAVFAVLRKPNTAPNTASIFQSDSGMLQAYAVFAVFLSEFSRTCAHAYARARAFNKNTRPHMRAQRDSDAKHRKHRRPEISQRNRIVNPAVFRAVFQNQTPQTPQTATRGGEHEQSTD
jgi:hypothetical protein